ncbi:MAG: iron-containing alcohol dehydrogenase [Marinobacter sp.]|uniref:iron-containing alcohol dehydrogenase n=1 Tax=Marinobacter sp. TaxID=50741 RepID=UPI00299E622F|nr:iron-containing alcohol dehydrogenase [Marinobacter sp.]MDX1755086.1 iron-containing alcohol dehydrogenase [Marinobacter sp.]
MITLIKTGFYRSLANALKVSVRFLPIRNPTLFSGQNASLELCDFIGQMGHRELLLVTDRVLVELGIVNAMVERLREQGVNVTLFDGVSPDPTSAQVDAGVALARSHHCDCVMAVGGGSPIDAAKAISACLPNAKSPRQLSGFFKVKVPPLPLYAVPTTAGTGSEATIAAVISDARSHKKQLMIDTKLVPKAAALDGRLMLGLPSAITAATGMDALTHAIEAYISRNATKETDELALMAAKLLFDNLEEAVANGQNLKARQSLAMASYYAGAAFTKAGVGYVHAISHNVGAAYGIAHGVANAMILPRVLQFSLSKASPRMAEMARYCGLAQEADSQNKAAESLIDAVRGMLDRFEMPYHLTPLREEDIPALANGALKEAHYSFYAVPKYLDQGGCESLIKDLLPVGQASC